MLDGGDRNGHVEGGATRFLAVGCMNDSLGSQAWITRHGFEAVLSTQMATCIILTAYCFLFAP